MAASFPNSASRALYEKLASHASAEHFKVLPDPVLFPDYYYFIRHPVALSDMARAMRSGRYTLADMQRDIRRMIANAKKYNKPEAVVYQDSLELEVRILFRLLLYHYPYRVAQPLTLPPSLSTLSLSAAASDTTPCQGD